MFSEFVYDGIDLCLFRCTFRSSIGSEYYRLSIFGCFLKSMLLLFYKIFIHVALVALAKSRHVDGFQRNRYRNGAVGNMNKISLVNVWFFAMMLSNEIAKNGCMCVGIRLRWPRMCLHIHIGNRTSAKLLAEDINASQLRPIMPTAAELLDVYRLTASYNRRSFNSTTYISIILILHGVRILSCTTNTY